MIERYISQFQEGFSVANVYHAVDVEYAVLQLKNNLIKPTTTHRYWKTGILKANLDDKSKEYRNSYWMAGISTTRDLDFAKKWRSVIYELDLEKIKQNYKVYQVDWGSNIQGRNFTKIGHEREEFILCGKLEKSYYNNRTKMSNINQMKKDINKIKPFEPLSKYLESIYISNRFNYDTDEFKEIELHPLFGGWI